MQTTMDDGDGDNKRRVVIEKFQPKRRDGEYLICPVCQKQGTEYRSYSSNREKVKLYFLHPQYSLRYIDKATGKILRYKQIRNSCYVGDVVPLSEIKYETQ